MTDSILRNRFDKNLKKSLENFISSINVDYRLYNEDIDGSIAHTLLLVNTKIISRKTGKKIINALEEIRKEFQNGKLKFKEEFEDIHMNIEKRLFEKIGNTAAFLHTARSRNDQVVLDTRLYLKKKIEETKGRIRDLQRTIVKTAKDNIDIIMPGYTHLQHAQPVLFAHHMMSYFEMFQRDVERFNYCYSHTDFMPLGSGALAGVGYPIKREFVARKLGFANITRNSIDSVSDRDFIIEFESAASICMMHLSRLSEELIIWSSSEFDFIELSDSVCTSSSIMPQKKNPDVLELIRGRTGKVYGNLLAILTVMKGLPLSYNRDMQEDKSILFETIDNLLMCLNAMNEVIGTMKVKGHSMHAAAQKGYLLATDIVDYLVRKGVPFRNAHSIVSRLVNYAIKHNKMFSQLSLEEYKKFSPKFEGDVLNIDLKASISFRNHTGGTSLNQVKNHIKLAEKILKVK